MNGKPIRLCAKAKLSTKTPGKCGICFVFRKEHCADSFQFGKQIFILKTLILPAC